MKRRRISGILIAVAGVVLASSLPAPLGAECHAPSLAYKHGVVTFTERGHTTQVRVEIADTLEKQEVGLMCRTSLDPDAGMLFWFADTTQVAFWMKRTLIPLSIVFIDADWHVVRLTDMKVAADPENGPFEYFPSPRPYRYALEVNLGFFAQHDIDENADVRFSP
jgi:uncharacterized protein